MRTRVASTHWAETRIGGREGLGKALELVGGAAATEESVMSWAWFCGQRETSSLASFYLARCSPRVHG